MWAVDYNEEEGKHFPVVAVEYGFLSVIS